MRKESVIEALNTLDDNFDAEQLIQKLLFIEKVEKGLEEMKQGKVVDFADVKQRFSEKWVK